MRKSKGTGTPFNVWLNLLDKEVRDKVKFLQLRDFYECNLTPQEVKTKVE